MWVGRYLLAVRLVISIFLSKDFYMRSLETVFESFVNTVGILLCMVENIFFCFLPKYCNPSL